MYYSNDLEPCVIWTFHFSFRPNNTPLRTILTPFYTKIKYSKRLLLKYIPANGEKNGRSYPTGSVFAHRKKKVVFNIFPKEGGVGGSAEKKGFLLMYSQNLLFFVVKEECQKTRKVFHLFFSVAFFVYVWWHQTGKGCRVLSLYSPPAPYSIIYLKINVSDTSVWQFWWHTQIFSPTCCYGLILTRILRQLAEKKI